MIQGKLLIYGDDISDIYSIRKNVFGETNLIFAEDSYDEQAIHVLVYELKDQNKAVAAGSIYYDGELCFINYVAVLKDYRFKKYGDFAVRMLLNKAFLSGIQTVYVKTPVTASGFFEKIGFVIDGIEFMYQNELYIEMLIDEQNLTVMCNRHHK